MSKFNMGARGAIAIGASTWAGTEVARGIYLGASGDVTLTMEDGTSVEFVALAAGIVHPLRFEAVTANSGTGGVVLL